MSFLNQLKWAIVSSVVLASASTQAFEVNILSAVVKDQTIPDAEVILQKNGETSLQTKTTAQGKAKIDSAFTDDSNVTLIVKKAGYSNLVVKCPCNNLTYAISPHMEGLDGLRIVLDWGAEPKDLDSHISFPGQHVFFSQKSGGNANLDVDDIDGFGPETITITKKHAGEKYLYAVHNYSEGDKKGSLSISSISKAKVFVYIGTSLVRTFYPPKNKVGNTWVVFGIGENGEFYDINKFADLSNREAVGGFMNDIIKSGNLTSVPEVTTDQKDLADTLNKQGEKEYHKKNYEDSVSLYLEAINNNPEHSQAYSNLGLVYQKIGKQAEALWANRKAIALANGANKNTVQASSYYNIARIYEDDSKWQDALDNYKTAKELKANPVYDKAIDRVKKKLGSN